jgi:hypothetical protein
VKLKSSNKNIEKLPSLKLHWTKWQAGAENKTLAEEKKVKR